MSLFKRDLIVVSVSSAFSVSYLIRIWRYRLTMSLITANEWLLQENCWLTLWLSTSVRMELRSFRVLLGLRPSWLTWKRSARSDISHNLATITDGVVRPPLSLTAISDLLAATPGLLTSSIHSEQVLLKVLTMNPATIETWCVRNAGHVYHWYYHDNWKCQVWGLLCFVRDADGRSSRFIMMNVAIICSP